METGTDKKCNFQGEKNLIYGVGSFQRGSCSPKGHLLPALPMTLAVFSASRSQYLCLLFVLVRGTSQLLAWGSFRLGSVYSYSHRERHTSTATTVKLCSMGARFANRRRFCAIVVTLGSEPYNLIWQQLSPGSTAVSTPGTLLAELHWAGGIYFNFFFSPKHRLTSLCEQNFLM